MDAAGAGEANQEKEKMEGGSSAGSVAAGSAAAGSMDDCFGVELGVDDRLIAQDSIGFWCTAKVLAVATAESSSRPIALKVSPLGFKA